jgi:cell wall-associated NlpC family hydrolase
VTLSLVAGLLPAGAIGIGPASAGVRDGEAGSGPPAPAPGRVLRTAGGSTWYDVRAGHWAKAAIDHVAGANDWMRDFGEIDGRPVFQPAALERRDLFARAIVMAFAPAEPIDPSLTFTDLADGDPLFPYANAAVKLGWMTRSGGAFRPADPVNTNQVHRALVLALGLSSEAAGLDGLHMSDGTRIATPRNFGTLVLGMRLGLRYNHGDESLDVGPRTPLTRAEVAWSLYRASTTTEWTKSSLARYASIRLPRLGPARAAIVAFGVRYAGYPYVWGGEWHRGTKAGYCCGSQPVGGFDCSGLVWWAMRAAGSGWSNQPPRPYRGWWLPQRSSRDMASVGRLLGWKKKRPGDLLFYDGNGDGVVDHVNMFIGLGWALDSSSGAAGVSIVPVNRGWYRDRFVGARRLIP